MKAFCHVCFYYYEVRWRKGWQKGWKSDYDKGKCIKIDKVISSNHWCPKWERKVGVNLLIAILLEESHREQKENHKEFVE